MDLGKSAHRILGLWYSKDKFFGWAIMIKDFGKSMSHFRKMDFGKSMSRLIKYKFVSDSSLLVSSGVVV